MDMLRGEQIAAAGLTDWRKLAQGLHARYLAGSFGTGARFVAAVGEAGDALDHHPRVVIGDGCVDLELVSADAVYRDDEGTAHVVEWVTQQDVDLARRITEIAADHGLAAAPAAVSEIELGLDTSRSATLAPVWAALLTGSAESQGRGTPGDEIRDATGRVPNLWFGDAADDVAPHRFHVVAGRHAFAAAEVSTHFAALVEANNGVWGGCWCMGFHPQGFSGGSPEGNRENKHTLVRDGEVRQVLVYDGDDCVGWCQFGTPTQLPNIKNPKAYADAATELPDWRIGCIFTGKGHRRAGVARAAVTGALAAIADAGGGLVEAYPEQVVDRKPQPGAFLPTGPETLFADLGFERDRRIAKWRWVMRRRVEP